MAEIWNLSALCRCCHVDGTFKSLNLSYMYDNAEEIYSQMLQDTFGITLTVPPNNLSYSICDDCIKRLRDALQFKLQVVMCEQNFQEYLQNEGALDSQEIKIEIDPCKDTIDKAKTDLFLEIEKSIKKEDESDYDGNDDRHDDTHDIEEVKSEDLKLEETVNKNKIEIAVKPKPKTKGKTKVAAKTKKNANKNKIEIEVKPKTEGRTKGAAKTKKIPSTGKARLTKKTCPKCYLVFETAIEMNNHFRLYHSDRGPYECVHCAQKFDQCEEIFQHVGTHGKSTVKCRFCEKEFKLQKKLQDHENSEHSERSLCICDICGKTFQHKYTLRRHLILHKGSLKKFFCDICGLGCNDRTNLRIHHETVHLNMRNYPCSQCDKTFKAKKNLKLHTLVVHEGQRPFSCKFCSTTFRSYDAVVRHTKKIHSKDEKEPLPKPGVYKCKICMKVYTHRGKYRIHINEHKKEGKLPTMCDICGISFCSKYTLDRHIRKHLGIKPYPCDLCTQRFTERCHLLRHKRNVHVEKKEKVKCPICKNNVRNLEKHNQIHEKRPFMCEICFKTYPLNNALNRHMKEIHLGIFKYGCDICKIGFKAARNLEKHYKKVHKDVKFKAKPAVGNLHYETPTPEFIIEPKLE